ncbi:MAG: MFS transporter [Actinomycetota bacterium]|nr:MFS transporter [Actinomycetota bacterium]
MLRSGRYASDFQHPVGYGWVVLGIGFLAQAAFAAVALGLPAMAPALRSTFELSLAEVGIMLAALSVGTTLTLIPWGVATDRVGERGVLLVGLGGCGIFLIWASTVDDLWTVAPLLLFAGMLGAVASVASGRAVMTWFDASRRGMALGVRQTAVPLGGALAALTLPPLVATAGVRWGLVALGGFCGTAALASLLWMRDSPEQSVAAPRLGTPTRDRRIWRLSLGSALLVFSQISILSFAVLFLHDARGMSATAAGAVLATIQLLGAAARIAVGRWSDRLGSRMIPLSRVAVGMAIGWALVPLLFHLPLWLLVTGVVATGAASVSWNGLSFTAAAEFAGSERSGTAIGLQQTVLFAAASTVPPLFGRLVEETTWRLSFGTLSVIALGAWIVLRPLVRAESERGPA